MGTVYLANDVRLDRKVALKVCHLADSAQALERFRREAKAAASLRHPNLCPIFEFDVQDDLPYFTMAFIEGPTLDRWVAQRGGLSQRDAALLVRKLALALQAAHSKGVIHRDLKPSNIALEKGEPVVLDFGLAKQGTGGSTESRLTQAGAILGTPSYMAPEQVEGDPSAMGPCCDIYSLGVILYELLTGTVPFKGPTTAVLAHILVNEPPRPRQLRPEVDPRLESICLKALAKKPGERFATMAEFGAALTDWARGTPPAAASTSRVPPALPPMETETLGSPPKAGSASPTLTHSPPPPVAATQAEVPPARKKKRRGRRQPSLLVPILAGVAVVSLLLSGVWLATRKGTGETTNKGKGGTAATANLPKEITNTIGMNLVLVPAGTFWMGSPRGEDERAADEERHEVHITRPFYLGAFEVTQREYERVMEVSPSWFSRTGGGKDWVRGEDTRRFPVEQVSWHDASAFCRKLSELPEEKKAGHAYRLPTEAEWEYACREAGRSATPFHFGTAIAASRANFDGNFPYGGGARGQHLGRPEAVGAYRPNSLGLFDMHGNVWEWCNDWYGEDFPAHGPREDPTGPARGDKRVLRGGSWDSYGKACRSASRNSFGPDYRNHFLGFRVALGTP
jgi:formylglycine-generating enzyme required for sulfatase activity